MNKEDVRQSMVAPIYVRPQGTMWEQLGQSRLMVLGILFLVTGALGLPLLWSSPSFSTSGKWFWSIVVSIYTALLILLVVAIVGWAYSTIVNATYY